MKYLRGGRVEGRPGRRGGGPDPQVPPARGARGGRTARELPGTGKGDARGGVRRRGKRRAPDPRSAAAAEGPVGSRAIRAGGGYPSGCPRRPLPAPQPRSPAPATFPAPEDPAGRFWAPGRSQTKGAASRPAWRRTARWGRGAGRAGQRRPSETAPRSGGGRIPGGPDRPSGAREGEANTFLDGPGPSGSGRRLGWGEGVSVPSCREGPGPAACFPIH